MSYPGKGKADHLDLGDWNAECWECGRKFKASTLLWHWQGYYVCKAHWEPRQPQDFVRSVNDTQMPPWTQPLPAWAYAARCYPNGITAIADYAVADCAVADFVSPMFDPSVTQI